MLLYWASFTQFQTQQGDSTLEMSILCYQRQKNPPHFLAGSFDVVYIRNTFNKAKLAMLESTAMMRIVRHFCTRFSSHIHKNVAIATGLFVVVMIALL